MNKLRNISIKHKMTVSSIIALILLILFISGIVNIFHYSVIKGMIKMIIPIVIAVIVTIEAFKHTVIKFNRQEYQSLRTRYTDIEVAVNKDDYAKCYMYDAVGKYNRDVKDFKSGSDNKIFKWGYTGIDLNKLKEFK